MSQPYPIDAYEWSEQLHEVARNRLPATITYQTHKGWTVLKARFVATPAESDLLAIDFVNPPDHAEPAPQPGQELGISYRRGSRKCVFTACFVDLSTTPVSSGGTRTTLRFTWPQHVEELQRRLYHRTPVPRGRLVPVDLWLAQAQEDFDSGALAQRGRMVDLSAGGLSVELPGETRPRWREDEQLSCRFAPGPDRPPIEVAAKLTHYTRLSDGHVRIGLQFLGLDTGERGRHTLQKISRMAQRLRE